MDPGAMFGLKMAVVLRSHLDGYTLPLLARPFDLLLVFPVSNPARTIIISSV